jgi:glycosyltransferase involved in cell wall biosynthesis
MPMKLSVIIPVYNESRTIDAVIRRTKAVELPGGVHKEIIIVNDGSTDGTNEILGRHTGDRSLIILQHDKNSGKSSAVMSGIEHSTGDIILIQDADLEYDPGDYPKLIEPIINNKASVVYGTRFKGTIEKMPLSNRIANIIATGTLNFLFGAHLSDLHTCYKVFKRAVLENIRVMPRHFLFDIQITTGLLALGHTIYEVPITYRGRTKEEGKKITWAQALELYWYIIKCRIG